MRGSGSNQGAGLPRGVPQRPYVIDDTPFDSAAVDQLHWREFDIGLVIKDDDPNPNEIKTVFLSSSLGEWEVDLDGDTWKVGGTPVGPNVAREIETTIEFEQEHGGDLRDLQGP
jgi:hypothetical protein